MFRPAATSWRARDFLERVRRYLLVSLQAASYEFWIKLCAARLARRHKTLRSACKHRDSALVPDF